MLFGCLLAFAAAFAPRVVLLFMWIVGPRVNAAFDNWIIPLLGIIVAPYTTIMYVLVWSPVTGVNGWDWIWIALGVMLDIMKWGQVVDKRKSVPGYPQQSGGTQTSAPAQQAAVQSTAKPAAAPQESPIVESDYIAELERLGEMHDQGTISDEEFETKKQELLNL
jgi:hypothetical protein